MCQKVRETLCSMSDPAYRQFQAKLMPGTDPERVLGVRVPLLRRYAKELDRDEMTRDLFLSELPHLYYDEYNLHGFLISLCRDYEKTVEMLDAFLPYVDNWATCDLTSPRVFSKHRGRLAEDVEHWLTSAHPFTVRFGIEMIQSHFLDKDFSAAWLERVSAIRREEYYVTMMIAWFFATALAKQWDSTVPYLENRRLDAWTHKKTIRKAIESNRITPEQKAYLRTLA